MKRECEYIRISSDRKRAIYVDSINKKEIIEYLERDKRHRKKFQFITDLILNGLRSKTHYCKVEINDKCKNITEIRFFPGEDNDRIYCKEVRSSEGTYVIVAAILHEGKKSKGLSSKEISLIKKVSRYEYDPK